MLVLYANTTQLAESSCTTFSPVLLLPAWAWKRIVGMRTETLPGLASHRILFLTKASELIVIGFIGPAARPVIRTGQVE